MENSVFAHLDKETVTDRVVGAFGECRFIESQKPISGYILDQIRQSGLCAYPRLCERFAEMLVGKYASSPNSALAIASALKRICNPSEKEFLRYMEVVSSGHVADSLSRYDSYPQLQMSVSDVVCDAACRIAIGDQRGYKDLERCLMMINDPIVKLNYMSLARSPDKILDVSRILVLSLRLSDSLNSARKVSIELVGMQNGEEESGSILDLLEHRDA